MFTSARRSGALIVSSLLALAVTAALRAQVPPPVAPATAPATRPTAATAPATTQASATKMQFNFVNAPMAEILQQMSDKFGFIIITSTGSPVPGNITMVSRGDYLDARQSINLINDVLYQFNAAVIETRTSPPNERIILRIVSVGEAKKSQIPVYQGNNIDEIPMSDALRTQVVPLTSIDAVRLRVDLTPLVSSDADITANAASNTIIITDTAAKIHRLVEIIRYMDTQPITKAVTQQKRLQYSNAADAARLVNNLSQNTGPQQPAGGGGAAGRGGGGGRGGGAFAAAAFGGVGAPGAGGSTSTSDYARNARLYADYDTRTNTVVISGPPDLVKTALELLEKLDQDPSSLYDTVFFVYPLRNAQSATLENVLNRVFGTGTGGGGGLGTAGARGAGAAFGTTGAGGGFGAGGAGGGFGAGGGGGRGGGTGGFGTNAGGRGGRGTTGGFGTAGGGGLGGGGGGGGGGFGGNLGRGNAGTFGGTTGGFGGAGGRGIAGSASGALAGNVFVVANPDINSLLVTTTKSLEPQVREIITRLDRPVPQVLIKVLMAEVTHSNSDDIGFEFGASNLRANGMGLTLGTNVISGTAPIAGGPTGGLKIGLVESQVNATLQALAKQSKLDVISRPYILVQDNQQAYMIIGQYVPYVTSSQVTTDGNTINQVAYSQVGVILQVIPHVNPDGLVTLDVWPQVSQLDSGNGVPISIGTNTSVSAPTFTVRQAISRIAIRNGETIVIGGLMQDIKTQVVDKIPVMGDIPYLGMLFKRTQNLKLKTELLIFLTPHVALDPSVLSKMSEEEQKTLKLVPHAVQPGVWEDQLKGMDAGTVTTQPAPEFRMEGGQLQPAP